jgi:hypothetical protein
MRTPFLSLVHTAAESLFTGLHLEKILVTVRHPRTGEIAQFQQDRHTPGLTLSRGYAMVAEPVRLSGRQVGQIELHAAAGSVKAAQLMLVAQSLHDEITQAIAA